MSRLSKESVLALTTSGISLVVGTLLGHIWTKKYVTDQYEALIEEEVTKAKAFYSQRNKTGEYADPVALAERLTGTDSEEAGDPVDTDEQEDDDYIVVEGKPFRDTVDPDERVNYNKLSENYKGPAIERQKYIPEPVEPDDGESMADYERRLMAAAHEKVEEIIHEVGDDEEYREEEVVVSNVFETNGVESLQAPGVGQRSSTRPYIISVTEFTDNDLGFGQNTISYYEGDNVLADERDQPIPDMNSIVGEKNLRFGEASGDANVVFIRNERLGVDFEVCRSPGTYAEEVLGVAPQEDRRRR
ncbi:hypothetical protein HWD32_gp59 [Gordonia phage Secretariat]|uniref:Uncharacterized protein n=1 Tax=Gordonia phage Secretariat TaxID=2725616 RepID=A0A6M3SUM2_9CAUD|nr:hypothetical protein HWD32_gp59 [Gordonia phage Secretariat]QJD49635.1 hypothetical protein SEA_SECRETARIAT_59 [Gordonia phage Secretariat]